MSMKATYVPDGSGTAYQVLGSTMTVKAHNDQTGGAYEFVVVETRQGADVVAHRHSWAESYFILEGTLEVQIGARRHEAGPGDFILIPARAVHGFRVLTETARFLHVSIGHGATEAFKDIDQRLPQPAGPDDVPTMLELAARHGIELVLPAGV